MCGQGLTSVPQGPPCYSPERVTCVLVCWCAGQGQGHEQEGCADVGTTRHRQDQLSTHPGQVRRGGLVGI